MTLAELLLERGELKKRVSELENRVITNVKFEEGQESYEDPELLLEKLSSTYSKLETLIEKTNRANATSTIDSGETIEQLIIKRQLLESKIASLKNIYEKTMNSRDRFSDYAENVKYELRIDAKSFVKNLNSLCKESRELNLKIQRANWITEVS